MKITDEVVEAYVFTALEARARDWAEKAQRTLSAARELQDYCEKIERDTDAAMAEEIQRLRRDLPKAEARIRELEAENARLREAIRPLASIADAYDANELEDEARKSWGRNGEFQNNKPPEEIELYSGRGGRTLLTLADCVAARSALDSTPSNATKKTQLRNDLVRMWVNQPSKFQPFHHLHGIKVLACEDVLDYMKIYFLNGSIVSMVIPRKALSEGWNSR